MPDADSVTEWIAQLKAGDQDASQRIWERYVGQLVRFARKRLREAPRRVADEDDVVLSAFHGFFRGVDEGRFPQLDDRDDLWQVLVMLTDRKSVDYRRRELAAKRGGGAVRGESALADSRAAQSVGAGLSQVVDGGPTPDFVVQFAEEFDRRMASLGSDSLRQIAILKLEGHTVQEISQKLSVSLSTIERKLRLIRRAWEESDS